VKVEVIFLSASDELKSQQNVNSLQLQPCSVVPAVLKFLKLQSCPEIVLKFEIVLKSQSFSTNVLILTVVVRAQ